MTLATSWVQRYRSLEGEEEIGRKVTFTKKVLSRAIKHENKERTCNDRRVGRINKSWETIGGDKVEKQRWRDMVDTLEEEEPRVLRKETNEESQVSTKGNKGQFGATSLVRKGSFDFLVS